MISWEKSKTLVSSIIIIPYLLLCSCSGVSLDFIAFESQQKESQNKVDCIFVDPSLKNYPLRTHIEIINSIYEFTSNFASKFQNIVVGTSIIEIDDTSDKYLKIAVQEAKQAALLVAHRKCNIYIKGEIGIINGKYHRIGFMKNKYGIMIDESNFIELVEWKCNSKHYISYLAYFKDLEDGRNFKY